MDKYRCNHCGREAYYDGRCGDGPVAMCDCHKWATNADGSVPKLVPERRDYSNYPGRD